MAYRIVFFDIDGTLLDEEKQIPEDTIDAIQTLKQNGVDVVIATGRAPYFFSHISERLGVDSFVSLNGSYVVYQGKPIYDRPIPTSTLEALDKMSRERLNPIVYQGGDECFSNMPNHPWVNEAISSLKVTVPGSRADFWKEAKIYQGLLFCEAHEEAAYQSAFSDISFVRWHRVSMDVIPKGGSKANGIQAMLDRLGISPAEAVAFGDGLNDKEMLSYVGMGIAMGNAHEEVKPFAKFVTKNVNDGGIRFGLEYVGLL